MDDSEIIAQLWARSEDAIAEVGGKYGGYCRTIAFNILGNAEDAEEVVNDLYSRLWWAVPPARPEKLKPYLGRIARNLALDRLEKGKAKKRGEGRMEAIFTELEQCTADKDPYATLAESKAITDALNSFLDKQKIDQRRVFLRRYWRAASIKEIALDFDISPAKVKSILFRMRRQLRKHLESEGIYL